MTDKRLYDRLINLEQLTREDWKKLLRELEDEDASTRARLNNIFQARINFDTVYSIDRLDRVSGRLAQRMILLTWVIVILTALLTIEPLIRLIHWIAAHRS